MFRSAESLRLGVFDINGTLYTDKNEMPAAVIEGIKSLHEKGVQSTVITGRSLSRATEMLGQLWGEIISPDMPVGVENGARLVDQAGNNLVFHDLGETAIEAVIDAAESHQDKIRYLAYTPQAKDAKNILWLPKDGSADEYLAANGNHTEVTRESLSNLAAQIACDRACMLRVGTSSPEVSDMLGGLNVFVNQKELNVMPDGVDKGTGVIDIARYLDVPLSQIIVAGNDYNDLPMLDLPVSKKVFVTEAPQDTILVSSPNALGEFLCSV